MPVNDRLRLAPIIVIGMLWLTVPGNAPAAQKSPPHSFTPT